MYYFEFFKPWLTRFTEQTNQNVNVNPEPEIVKQQVTVYVPVSHHVYFDGHSFRVRYIKKNKKVSRSFPTKRGAIGFRDRHIQE